MEAGLQAVRELVAGAALPDEVKRSVQWSVDQLPPLYREYERTRDTRFRDTIMGRVRGMLSILGKEDVAGAEGHRVMVGIVQQLQDVHERLNLPNLDLKAPALPKPRAKRKPKPS